MKNPKHRGTRMEKVEGIRFADPRSAIYSTRLFVGSRHLGPWAWPSLLKPPTGGHCLPVSPQSLELTSPPIQNRSWLCGVASMEGADDTEVG